MKITTIFDSVVVFNIICFILLSFLNTFICYLIIFFFYILGKYRITSDGSLIIEKADLSDGKKKYRCICRDEMDNDSVSSEPWGQLIVTGKLHLCI